MSDESLLGWCVVANVGSAGGVETAGAGWDERGGTRHFSAGTKVWVLPPQWGDGGEDVFVVGRHRGKPGGLVRMVIPRRHLIRFRVAPVYSPSVMAQLERPWRGGQPHARVWSTKDEAEQVIAGWGC